MRAPVEHQHLRRLLLAVQCTPFDSAAGRIASITSSTIGPIGRGLQLQSQLPGDHAGDVEQVRGQLCLELGARSIALSARSRFSAVSWPDLTS